MIGLEHVWFAVGIAIGVVAATMCLVAVQIWESYMEDKERVNGRKYR